MPDSYQKLFRMLGKNEPTPALFDAVVGEINARAARRDRVRAILFGGLFMAGLIGLIPAWQELSSEIAQSGFFQFVSLIFSDAGALLASWKEFLGTLAETFPAFGISALFASVLALVWSLRYFVRHIHPAVRRPSGLIHAR